VNPLTLHPNFLAVRNAAAESRRDQRSLAGITEEIVLLARLYTYGFRGEIIGAFHATALALEKQAFEPEAIEQLRALAALSIDPVPADYRVVLGNFHRYDQSLARVISALDRGAKSDAPRVIRANFLRAIERITASSGIAIARDDVIPEQASFIVPSLGITIVPLVYGDQHSWNMAFLSGEHLDVPRHLHREGIEIHLGMGELRGETCLAGSRAEVREGYAMPIPPGTPHGFINHAGHEHRLPFIFGSRRLGGWGIIPDVDPRPIDPAQLAVTDVLSKEMNGTVLIDREIAAAGKAGGNVRRTLIPPERTFSPHAGGLVLSIAHIAGEMTLQPESFQTVSVVRGRGTVAIGPAEAELSPHDHFGIPAGARAVVSASGQEPLVLLDAVLVERLQSSSPSTPE